MRRRRAKEHMDLNAEINVVSLIDVMMLLLVIFMLTAPMMTGGLDLRLPEADAKPIEATGGLTVSIDRNNTIFLNEQAMTLQQFRSVFASRAKRSKEKTVRLQMDGSVKWDLHAQVVTVINNAGIVDIAYVLNPTQEAGK
jgi:biopolymer transport protein ExbD/biopolymer transport protein TolR